MNKYKFPTIIIILIMISVVLTSCKNEPSEEYLKLETADKELKSNLKMYEAVWDDIVNKREIDKINETYFDKNITLVASPENIVGIEGFKSYYQNFLTGFSDIDFTIENLFGHGDKIVKHWRFKGTHSGNFFGIPATGKEISIDGVTLVEMKNGKISQEQDFMDNLDFMQQLGIIPKN